MLTKIIQFLKKPKKTHKKTTGFLKIALLYIKNPNIPQTVADNIDAFKKYSVHEISFIPYNDQETIKNLENFDCVAIHYYSQVYTKFSRKFTKILKKYKGLKVVFSQDDYDLLDMNREKYKQIGVDILFSAGAINNRIRERLYPQEFFSSMKVINCLPGYVSEMDIPSLMPIQDRKIDLFYRGNSIGIAYGRIGYEKIEIGAKMKAYLEKETNLTHDIEVCISKQIYGPAYLDHMRRSRATLVTESGSGIIDHTLKDRIRIIEESKEYPELPFEYFVEKYSNFYQEDGFYLVNTLPPKALEAIACKTALIAYEGEYSGVLIPHRHYIALKKDWSNIEEVVLKLKDHSFLQKLVDQSYEDIVMSGNYSYQKFIEVFDAAVRNSFTHPSG